jgi:hypothetical protein
METQKQISPLAEKRMLFFNLKKQMIGRRAYSDSVRGSVYKIREQIRQPLVTIQPPRFDQAYIDRVTFEISAC